MAMLNMTALLCNEQRNRHYLMITSIEQTDVLIIFAILFHILKRI